MKQLQEEWKVFLFYIKQEADSLKKDKQNKALRLSESVCDLVSCCCVGDVLNLCEQQKAHSHKVCLCFHIYG